MGKFFKAFTEFSCCLLLPGPQHHCTGPTRNGSHSTTWSRSSSVQDDPKLPFPPGKPCLRAGMPQPLCSAKFGQCSTSGRCSQAQDTEGGAPGSHPCSGCLPGKKTPCEHRKGAIPAQICLWKNRHLLLQLLILQGTLRSGSRSPKAWGQSLQEVVTSSTP